MKSLESKIHGINFIKKKSQTRSKEEVVDLTKTSSFYVSIKDLVTIIVACLITAIGIYFFKFPNKISTGGVSGIAIIVPYFINVTPGFVTVVFNLALLLTGFIVFGRNFGVKTTYASLFLSFFIWVFEKTIPIHAPLTNEPILELLFAILLPGLGAAMLFNIGASSGGTDIIAMIVRKFTNKEIGNSLFITDMVIAVTIFFVYGMKSGLMSFAGLLFKAIVVNAAINSFNQVKYFTIVTDKFDEINEFINKTLGRGHTFFSANGGYTRQNRTVILTVVNNTQAEILNNFIRKVDPHAFVMVTSTSNINGKGFKSRSV